MIRFLFLLLGLLSGLSAQDFPLIIGLSQATDPAFRQHQKLLAAYYRQVSRKEPLPDPVFFRYTTGKTDDFFFLAARTGLNYETLATINSLSRAESLVPGLELIIPTVPGLYIPQEDPGELGMLMNSLNRETPARTLRIPVNSQVKTFLFYPGVRFHPLERAFFLGILFRFPLGSKGRITSSFGSRRDPFGGHESFHNGVDLAAPIGTEVLAAREGTVRQSGYDQTLGNFISVVHPGGFETVYGHMSTLNVRQGHKVYSGEVIGFSGSTGRSTGPHLHFEIRKEGQARDPVPLLPK